jgi:hypothetical protein
MKKIINLLLLLAVVLFVACDETVETPETLEVKPYNLEGTWVLAELNGDALADSAYVYLVIDRGYTYEIYENTASMYPVLFTGKYELEYDWRVGDVISGTYDYDLGAWDHEYVITNLYEKSMTWTAKDDASYVQEFVRVDAVPAEIVEAVRK